MGFSAPAALTDLIRDASTAGDTARLRTAIDGLVHEIRVTGRHDIKPTYRLPTPRTLRAVRASRSSRRHSH